MEGKGSIFDHAGDAFKKKEPQPPPKKSETPKDQQVKKVSDEQIRQMFKKVYELNDAVAKKLDVAYKMVGKSKGEIKIYLENPSNFPDDKQWKTVQQSRMHLLSKLERTILYKGEQEPPKEEKERKKKKQADSEAEKKRKGKTLGSRKGWLSM